MSLKNTSNRKNKTSFNFDLAKITAAAMIISGLLSHELSYSQNLKSPNHSNKKTQTELVQESNIDHDKFIAMNVDSILTVYGQEK